MWGRQQNESSVSVGTWADMLIALSPASRRAPGTDLALSVGMKEENLMVDIQIVFCVGTIFIVGNLCVPTELAEESIMLSHLPPLAIGGVQKKIKEDLHILAK